jgi:hypothetical protein
LAHELTQSYAHIITLRIPNLKPNGRFLRQQSTGEPFTIRRRKGGAYTLSRLAVAVRRRLFPKHRTPQGSLGDTQDLHRRPYKLRFGLMVKLTTRGRRWVCPSQLLSTTVLTSHVASRVVCAQSLQPSSGTDRNCDRYRLYEIGWNDEGSHVAFRQALTVDLIVLDGCALGLGEMLAQIWEETVSLWGPSQRDTVLCRESAGKLRFSDLVRSV